jgi:dolichyl-phosphooligosaccharide-protein glycotransferase
VRFKDSGPAASDRAPAGRTGSSHGRVWPTAVALAIAVGGALSLRSVLSYRAIFQGGWVAFVGSDPWYHMRLVDNLLHHFPNAITFDPYLLHPGGEAVFVGPLFDFLIAAAALLIGAGHPSAHLVDAAGAWMPALLGALTPLPVYFCARRLWGRAEGLVAAGLVAVLPGQFLERSLLGYTDHHVAEALLSAALLLFLVRGATTPAEKSRRIAAEGALAGLALGLYLLTWIEGSGLVLLVALWALWQFVSDAARGKAALPLANLLAWQFVVAAALVLPFAGRPGVPWRSVGSLAAGLAVAAAVAAGSKILTRAGFRLSAKMLVLGGGALIAAGALVLDPSLLGQIRADLAALWPRGGPATIAEAIPLLRSGPGWLAFWREFTAAAATALLGAILLAVRAIGSGRAEDGLLVVWTAGIAFLALGQNRFSYYLAVPVALLSASLLAWIVPPSRRRRSSARAGAALPLAAVGLLVMVGGPSLRLSLKEARGGGVPDRDWRAALQWLAARTPEPFGQAGAYLLLYPGETPGRRYPVRSSYGVMAWWDYGYWIIRLSHRVPVSNPTQAGAESAARFYTAQSEGEANAILDSLGAPYVIVDATLTELPAAQRRGLFGKLGAMALWAGQPVGRYYERCEIRDEHGRWSPIDVFYPAYFRTMAVRLYTFSGRSYEPADSSWVATVAPPARAGGAGRIVRARRFSTASEAQAFLAGKDPATHRLVSFDPFASCVPLESLPSFLRVYASPTSVLRRGSDRVGEVEIFAHGPPGPSVPMVDYRP